MAVQWEEEYLSELERLHSAAGEQQRGPAGIAVLLGRGPCPALPYPVPCHPVTLDCSCLPPCGSPVVCAGPRAAGEYVMAESNPFLLDTDSFAKGRDLFK